MLVNLEEIWFWVYLILALPAAIYYVIKLYGYVNRRKAERNTSYSPAVERSIVLKIQQREPSKRPPAILSIVLIICSFLLLAFGAWAIYLWVAGKVAVRVDIWMILFFVIFLAFPLYSLVDHFIMQPRFYRLGRSIVAKEAKVVLDGDANTAFDSCHRALDAMKATIIKMNKPNMLKARLGKSLITIQIKHRKGSKVRANILCDSQWLTVKFDAGANQRYINTFLNELIRQ